MGCNCGSKSASTKKLWVVTTPSGEKKTYSTEVEAVASAKRVGGTYKQQ